MSNGRKLDLTVAACAFLGGCIGAFVMGQYSLRSQRLLLDHELSFERAKAYRASTAQVIPLIADYLKRLRKLEGRFPVSPQEFPEFTKELDEFKDVANELALYLDHDACLAVITSVSKLGPRSPLNPEEKNELRSLHSEMTVMLRSYICEQRSQSFPVEAREEFEREAFLSASRRLRSETLETLDDIRKTE